MSSEKTSAVRTRMLELCRRYAMWDWRMERALNWQRVFAVTPDIRNQLRSWFEARYEVLAEEYREAINADENMIAGKQYEYDVRPKLPRR